HLLTHLDEGFGTRCRRAVEGPYHRREHWITLVGGRRWSSCLGSSRRYRARRGERWHLHRILHRRRHAAGVVATDADRFFAFTDFNFRDVRFFEQLDQFFYFSDIHGILGLMKPVVVWSL